VLASVVHRDRVAEHRRDDHRTTGPGLDDLLAPLLVLDQHLLHQVVVHEGAFLEATWHRSGSSSPRRHGLTLLSGLAAADDQLAALLAGPPRTLLRLTPRRHRVPTTGGPTLTTTERVVHRVHDDTPDLRTPALPTHAAGLAPVDVALLGVADLTDRGPAPNVDHPDLTGRHAQGGLRTLLRRQLDGGTGGTGDLRAATGLQLDRVDRGADRDVAQREVVARLDVRAGSGLHPCALSQPGGRQDVPLLAVGVVQQGDPRGPVRVVL